ncbi:hypothetical protein F5148DRAFT_1148826 [Russula earlei]|uniref:Uncharacterized protein n=1 Tax=Russula earlei TaxID=71964 RepID=A0ACC0UD31_9AGAM|nr:hypothetical protein F5148DRAFT_1148826 [Russula earlei]
MAGDACEKFVGPMPICEFLSEFIPKASQDRPAINFNFEHNSVSQNEGHFDPLRSHWTGKYNDSAYKICSQLITYASTLHHSQFHLFSFAIILFGKSGRLLQWDCSSLIYSEPFYWVEKHDTLFEFIWRLNFLSNADRGQDTTVISVVPNDEATVAISKLNEYEGLMIKKDFWHIDHQGTQKEGDMYRELHGAQVPHILVFGQAGNVPLSPDHANTVPLVVQRTKMQDYTKGKGKNKWCLGRPNVDLYVHYQLVLETLGQLLSTFKSTWQLCQVIQDAIMGKNWCNV